MLCRPAHYIVVWERVCVFAAARATMRHFAGLWWVERLLGGLGQKFKRSLCLFRQCLVRVRVQICFNGHPYSSAQHPPLSLSAKRVLSAASLLIGEKYQGIGWCEARQKRDFRFVPRRVCSRSVPGSNFKWDGHNGVGLSVCDAVSRLQQKLLTFTPE
jgi:hypothetical protein